MTNSGLAMHVHHDKLFEFCYDYEERLLVIEQKPLEERELRKRLFQIVKSPLPAEVKAAGEAVRQTWEAHRQAGKAYIQAGEACCQAEKAYNQAHDLAWETVRQAGEAYDQAYKALNRALAAHEEEMLAIHARECPDCPWDGKSIFGKGDKK